MPDNRGLDNQGPDNRGSTVALGLLIISMLLKLKNQFLLKSLYNYYVSVRFLWPHKDLAVEYKLLYSSSFFNPT